MLGGTFNPIHKGHLWIAQIAFNSLQLDRVIFLPSGNPPHKANTILPFELRYELVKKAIHGMDFCSVSPCDAQQNTYSYTDELLQRVQQKYPSKEFYFIIGEDNVEQLANWHNAEWLLQHANFIVVTRTCDHTNWSELSYLKRLHFVSAPAINISSTQIREALCQGESVVDLVPETIYPEVLGLKSILITMQEKACMENT